MSRNYEEAARQRGFRIVISAFILRIGRIKEGLRKLHYFFIKGGFVCHTPVVVY